MVYIIRHQRLVVSKIVNSIKSFHLGFYIRRACIAMISPGTPDPSHTCTSWPVNSTVDMGRETRQRTHATSRDRLASETSEEREARLMSRAARV